MKIPNEVMSVFLKEVESISYGKVSLGIIRRGRHEHYEIDKHITMVPDCEFIVSGEKKASDTQFVDE